MPTYHRLKLNELGLIVYAKGSGIRRIFNVSPFTTLVYEFNLYLKNTSIESRKIQYKFYISNKGGVVYNSPDILDEVSPNKTSKKLIKTFVLPSSDDYRVNFILKDGGKRYNMEGGDLILFHALTRDVIITNWYIVVVTAIITVALTLGLPCLINYLAHLL